MCLLSFTILLLLIVSGVLSKYEILERNHHNIDQVSIIFDKFIEKYDKKYSPDEYNYRLDVFKDNLIKINEWNEINPGMFGINHFADLKYEELSMGCVTNTMRLNESSKTYEIGDFAAPEYLDWRSSGIVSPVKNQFGCGSCYAFGAVGHLESLYAKKHRVKPPVLAEQQIVDCDNIDNGCGGGQPHKVFRYLMESGGIMLQDDYIYEGRQGDCMFDKDKAVLKVTSANLFDSVNEIVLKHMVADFGPISIALYASEKMIRLKTSRVIKPSDVDCNGSQDMNHAVLIVGYGRENDDDYWIIKNSWGSHWADRGYMKIARGVGACKIGSYSAIAEVE